MRSFLLTGNSEDRSLFIKNFISEEKISEHNVVYFGEELNIENTKELRKLLSKRFTSKTIFVISKINVIAQNALLKTIEELHDLVSIIVSIESPDEVIDTVKSRLFHVSAGRNKDFDFELNISKFESSNLGSKLEEIDQFIQKNTEDFPEEAFRKFILSYRKSLLKNKEQENYLIHSKILKNLIVNFKLVKNNNVNLRLALENSILHSF